MKPKFDLRYNGAVLSTWEIPSFMELTWGMLVAVPYEGRLRIFRLISMSASELELAPEFQTEKYPYCV